jgi:lysophospholipase
MMAKMSNLNTPIPRPAALPPDREGFFERAGGRLRYGVWNPARAARGSIVLVQGRAEFIEKYAMEVIGELRDRGFAVYALDIRGQGLSERMLPDHDKGHIDDFATYVADLKAFLETVVTPAAPQPLLLFSHSTGGNIALRFLGDEGCGLFAAAAFCSPMTGLPNAWLARLVLAITGLLPFLDTRYAPTTGPYDPGKHPFAGNDVTHDERRYDFTAQWFAADPRLRLGGPTIGWVRQAYRSFDTIDAPGYLERLTLPVLIVSAGHDTVVDTATHTRAVARIAGARHAIVEGARHEILLETDDLRAQFWDAFDRLAKSMT